MFTLRKEKQLMLAALILGTAITLLLIVGFKMIGKEEALLNENFLRFHVLANSDSEEDQALKLKVRDAVIDYLEPVLKSSESKEETKRYILKHLPQITDVAGRVLREAGSSDSLRVMLGVSEFPTKSYGSVTLPAGRYEALRIEIGAAEGHNWWCVMFPSLCFVDEMDEEEFAEMEERQLPEEAGEFVHHPNSFRFKLLEWLHEVFS